MKTSQITRIHEDNIRPFLDEKARDNVHKINAFWDFDEDDHPSEMDNLEVELPDEAFSLLDTDVLTKRAKEVLGDEVVSAAARAKGLRCVELEAALHPPQPKQSIITFLLCAAALIGVVAFLGFKGLSMNTTNSVELTDATNINSTLDAPVTPALIDDNTSVADAGRQPWIRDEDLLAIASFEDVLNSGMLRRSTSGNGWKEEYNLNGQEVELFQISLTDSAANISQAGRSIGFGAVEMTIISAVADSAELINTLRMQIGDNVFGYLGYDPDGHALVHLYYVPNKPSRMMDIWGLERSDACGKPIAISSAGHFIPAFSQMLEDAGQLQQMNLCTTGNASGSRNQELVVRISAAETN